MGKSVAKHKQIRSYLKKHVERAIMEYLETQKYDAKRKGVIAKQPLRGVIAQHIPCGMEDQEKVFMELRKTRNCPVCKKRIKESEIKKFIIE
jgi:hypothetical protein